MQEDLKLHKAEGRRDVFTQRELGISNSSFSKRKVLPDGGFKTEK